MLQIAQRLGEERVGAFLDVIDTDEPRLVEQRWAGQRNQLPGDVPVGLEIADLETRILGPQQVAQNPDGSIRQEPLGAGDQHDRRRPHPSPFELRNHRCLGGTRSGCRCGQRDSLQPSRMMLLKPNRHHRRSRRALHHPDAGKRQRDDH